MSDDSKQPDIPQRLREALAVESLSPLLKRALEHPRRVEIFLFLADRSDGKATSEQELVEAFDMGIHLVEYHLKVLHNADLIAQVEDAQEQVQDERAYVAAGFMGL